MQKQYTVCSVPAETADKHFARRIERMRDRERRQKVVARVRGSRRSGTIQEKTKSVTAAYGGSGRCRISYRARGMRVGEVPVCASRAVQGSIRREYTDKGLTQHHASPTASCRIRYHRTNLLLCCPPWRSHWSSCSTGLLAAHVAAGVSAETE